ncbi:MAG: hypothetical protein D6702_10835 [Planctomycetota bacterium]|nr:MAG: hypothetical protein D6702_10835 [Planctomycetota bacterium]
MTSLLLALPILALAAPATAQVVTEVPGMTVQHSFIDMDLLPLGPTNTAALNAAGTNGGATMAALTMSPKTTSAPGVYNTQVCGYALAAGPGTGGSTPYIIDNSGFATFDAMLVSIDFGGPCTEFGMMLGDWIGPAVLNFYSGGSLIYTHTSSTFTQCGAQFYQMSGGTFDRVDIDVSTSAGNWVLMELYVEQTVVGPTLSVSNLVAGQTATISVSNCTPNGIVRHGYSLFGGGPVNTPYGQLLLSPPYRELPAITCDAAGNGSMTARVPAGTTGIMVWQHAFDLGSLTFTNGISNVIG